MVSREFLLSLIRNFQTIVTPPKLCGIYFLMQGDQIVYIGQSHDLIQRAMLHRNEATKEYDSVRYLECPAGILDELELTLILIFHPKYNSSHYREDEGLQLAEFPGRARVPSYYRLTTSSPADST